MIRKSLFWVFLIQRVDYLTFLFLQLPSGVYFYSSKDGWNIGYYLTEDKLKVSRGSCFLVAVYYIWPRYGKPIDLDDVTLSL
jgi:hypothetical protein